MYVTDTHALIYFTSNKKSRLGRKARRIFEAADSGASLIQVPTIVLWEVSLLLRQNYIFLPQRFDHWCRSIDSSRGFSILPLEWTDIDEARALPFADPYDCLISGASRRMTLPLITKDDVIASSGLVDTIW
jgi:PIN domain nuclease of toxin-antitoxin system